MDSAPRTRRDDLELNWLGVSQIKLHSSKTLSPHLPSLQPGLLNVKEGVKEQNSKVTIRKHAELLVVQHVQSVNRLTENVNSNFASSDQSSLGFAVFYKHVPRSKPALK